MGKTARAATLKDVAEASGVTTATVARVLKARGYVSEATRTRVLQAVDATGYRPNSLARSLRQSRSHVIGHLLKATVPNPFYVEVARGVEEEARARGYTVLTANVQHDAETERRAVETFLGWRADGLIFSTPADAANVEHVLAQRVPLAQVERPRSQDGHRLVVRNYPSAVTAMRHLADLGHRRIAYVGADLLPEDGPTALYGYVERERLQAWCDVMAAVGAATDGLAWFGEAYTIDQPTAQGHGYRATQALLAARERPTAIFASNDILAAGALQAIHEAGLNCPRDISVVGFDDTLAGFLTPLLTSVRLPARRLGATAVRMVIDEIEGKGPGGQQVALDAEFVLRRSTAAARSPRPS
jgi:LacI family transcriptional regulator